MWMNRWQRGSMGGGRPCTTWPTDGRLATAIDKWPVLIHSVDHVACDFLYPVILLFFL